MPREKGAASRADRTPGKGTSGFAVPARFLSAGDRSQAICPICKSLQDTEYQYRSVFLEKSKIHVHHVLVGICLQCETSVSLPAQSTPRIKEARQRVMKEQNARISLELEDRLNMMAAHMDARPEPFKGALCRYALTRVVHDAKFARRVWKHAQSAAKGTPGARVKFRAEAVLPERAMAIAHASGVNDLSKILRGAFLTVDELLSAPKDREAITYDLRLLAVGSGA